ncbi:MAG: hypothetical protein A2494_03940 [Candidatus Lloydbacteria bacterium RIFOXYC12_FULL_46_25]|uniref:TraG N-terminal Proteobacteria domain-containing protein n=1 Tax=Candidatus Lloydbacteria bacterium RIFOXYC12_FULL_46_25 TaxID=1798670 RepID=A0A1G2DSV4_9BACT|nr:MAG: hypothetical protein A2494_03940 [Candidatus Lloydbacteria bacterium RIFOXYC12_FULL_46_25]
MTSKSFKKQKRGSALMVLAFLLIGFFTSVNSAFAHPFIASAPSAGNDICFQATDVDSGLFTTQTYCYPSLAACETDYAAVAWAEHAGSCIENFSKKSWTEKTSEQAGKVVSDAVGGILDAAGDLLLSPLVLLSWIFFKTAGLFLAGMGSLLDIAISSTINGDFYKGLTVIDIGWTTMRDFANMFFIFALLFIAIKTILGLAGSNTKRWVAHLIIAALLINFSLFMTKVVIDAGNVLAWGFWDKMQITSGGVSGPTATMHLLEGFKLQSVVNPVDSSGTPIDLDSSTKIMLYLGGGLMMFIAGYVFLAGAILMMVRSVTLIVLMILSPIAFLGFALPVGSSLGSKWLSKLIGSAFVAPAFVAMLYLVSTIINSPDLFKLTSAQGKSIGGAIAGDISSYAIIYNYLLMIILVLASLSVANAVSAGAGSQAGAWAKKGLGGGGAVAALGFGAAGRQTIGRAGANKLKDAEWVKEQNRLIAKGGMRGRLANIELAGYQKASKGSFDVRNVSVMGKNVNSALGYGGVNVGQGAKRSYDTHGAVLSSVTGGYRGTEKEAEILKKNEERFKNAPDAQDAENRRMIGASYDTAKHKEVREKLASDIRVKEQTDIIKAETDKEKDIRSKLKEGAITKEDAEGALKAVTEAIGQAMKKVPPRKIADMIPLYAGSEAFAGNMDRSALHTVHQQALEGKYDTLDLKDAAGSPVNFSDHLTKSVMGGNNEDAKKYLMSTEGQKRLFNFDAEKYRPDYEIAQKSRDRIANIDLAHDAALAENAKIDAASAAKVAEEAAKAAAKRAEESAAFASTIGVAGQSYSKRA